MTSTTSAVTNSAVTNSGTSNAWIRRFHPSDDAATRLLCFPHAGGSASYYFPVSRALAPGIDVLSIQYPGRQDRRSEPSLTSIEELADQIVAQLDGWLDRPFAMFGHSMGATVAFEVARRLDAQDTSPVALFASGRRAPSAYRDERVHLGDDEQVLAELRQLSGTDSQILGDDEIVRMILPAIRNDYVAAETYIYRPGPDVTCPIIALVGDDDPKVDRDEAQMWGAHTTGPFEMTVFTGGHFFLTEHAPAILAKIEKTLAVSRLV